MYNIISTRLYLYEYETEMDAPPLRTVYCPTYLCPIEYLVSRCVLCRVYCASVCMCVCLCLFVQTYRGGYESALLPLLRLGSHMARKKGKHTFRNKFLCNYGPWL